MEFVIYPETIFRETWRNMSVIMFPTWSLVTGHCIRAATRLSVAPEASLRKTSVGPMMERRATQLCLTHVQCRGGNGLAPPARPQKLLGGGPTISQHSHTLLNTVARGGTCDQSNAIRTSVHCASQQKLIKASDKDAHTFRSAQRFTHSPGSIP